MRRGMNWFNLVLLCLCIVATAYVAPRSLSRLVIFVMGFFVVLANAVIMELKKPVENREPEVRDQPS